MINLNNPTSSFSVNLTSIKQSTQYEPEKLSPKGPHVHNDTPSEKVTIKSSGPLIEIDGSTPLSELPKEGRYIVSTDLTPRMKDLATISKLVLGDKFDPERPTMGKRRDLSYALIDIQRDFRSDTAGGLGSKEWDTFMEAAVKSGSNVDKLILQTDKLEGKEQLEFINYAASLSEEDLGKFLEAVDKAPSAGSIIATAKELSGDMLGLYFESIALARGNTNLVDQALSKVKDDENIDMVSFFEAAIKTDDKIQPFLRKAVGFSGETINNIIGYINSEDDPQNIKNFVQFMRKSDENTTSAIIDLAATFNDEDTAYLLKVLAGDFGPPSNPEGPNSKNVSGYPGSEGNVLGNFINTAL